MNLVIQTLDEVLTLTAETEDVDFKSHFEPTSLAEMLEVIKDIVAMANSGGGYILFGINDSGEPLALEERALADVDPATIGDKIHKYTGVHFSKFSILEAKKDATVISVLSIGPSEYPIVFSTTGNYTVDGNKQKNAFQAGMVYFRHGAKSEPGVYEDLRHFFDRKIESFRMHWLENIARVIESPVGSTFHVMTPGDVPDATKIAITSDPSAPKLYLMSPDDTHPYRLKDLIKEVCKAVGSKIALTSHDIQCVRKEFNMDHNKEYVVKFAHASPQYSPECVKFLADSYSKDSYFFVNISKKHKKTLNDTQVGQQAIHSSLL